jgi:membrane protein
VEPAGAPGPARGRVLTRVGGVAGTGVRVVADTYEAWRADRAIRLGAGLAYYALFAVVPVLTLAAWLASLLVSRDDVEAALHDAFDGILDAASGTAASELADVLLRGTTRASLGILGLAALLLAASLLFVALQDALNMIWGVPVRRGVGTSLRRRALAFVIVLLLGAYLVVAVLVSSIGRVVEGFLPAESAVIHTLSAVIDALSSWAIGIAILVLLFRLLAPVELAWRHLLAGGTLTAVLVVIGTELLGLYIDRVASASFSGVAGALLLFLVWLYYEAQIILVGAEFTKVIALRWPVRS